MLKINNLTVSSKYTLIEDFSLQIKRGEIVRLLGNNGTGKTIILTALSRLLAARYNARLAAVGNLEIESELFDLAQPRTGNDKSFLVWDQPISQLLAATPFDNLLWQRSYSSLYMKNLFEIPDILKAIRLENKSNRDVSHLSVGEKQLVALAVSMVSHYDLLLFDEVESHLDPSNVRRCSNLISEFSKDRYVLLTTHNPKIFFSGTNTYYLPELKTFDLSEIFLDLLNGLIPTKKVNGFFRNLTFKYNKERESVLDNVSFEFKEGEKIAVIGRNGSGKSTLLHILAKAIKAKCKYNLPDSSLCVQESAHLIWNVKVADYFQSFNTEIKNKIIQIFPTQNVPKLSFGFRRLLTILSVSLQSKDVLIFDEPDVGLSREWHTTVAKWLSALSTNLNKTVFVCSHNEEFLSEFNPTRSIRIKNAKIEQNHDWNKIFFNETFLDDN